VLVTNEKILVTYASRSGSTVGVAQAIGQVLVDSGAQVDVLPMQEVSDLAQYRAVVAGSAIQGKKWLPEAMQFIKAHQAELNRMPSAMFTVCMTLTIADGKYRQEVSAWLEPVRQLLHPASEGLFAGVLDISKVPSFSERLKFRLSVAMGVWTEGDHRDWEAVREWAAGLRPLLVR
jgi:menaquinone-dependent protoporphyrinogen oxidase